MHRNSKRVGIKRRKLCCGLPTNFASINGWGGREREKGREKGRVGSLVSLVALNLIKEAKVEEWSC